jgi:hypothetical protein
MDDIPKNVEYRVPLQPVLQQWLTLEISLCNQVSVYCSTAAAMIVA